MDMTVFVEVRFTVRAVSIGGNGRRLASAESYIERRNKISTISKHSKKSGNHRQEGERTVKLCDKIREV